MVNPDCNIWCTGQATIGEYDDWEPEFNLRDAPAPVAKYEEYLHTVSQGLAPLARPKPVPVQKRGRRSGACHN